MFNSTRWHHARLETEMILAGTVQSVDRVSEAFTRSRPAPTERLGPGVPRHCRILPPQIACLGRTAISLPGLVFAKQICSASNRRYVPFGCVKLTLRSRPPQHLRLGKSEMFDQAAKFRKSSARFPADHSRKTCRHTLRPLAWLE